MGYLQIVALVVSLVSGISIGYVFEHSKVLILESRIKDQKIEAADTLAKEISRVTIAEQAQRTLNLELDKSREALISTANAYSLKQHTLIDSLQFTNGRKSSSLSESKSANTEINSGDEEKFTWVSKKLLNYLAGESRRADQDGIDKNTLMTFVIDQNCGIER